MASIIQRSEMVRQARESGLTGLLEPRKDFPQEVKYVSFSGSLPRLRTLGHLQPEQGSVWDTQERTSWLAAEVGQRFI